MSIVQNGTLGYIDLITSSTYVKTTETNFNYVYPLSLITDDNFWDNITAESNISIYDVNALTKRPRYINGIIDTVNKKGLIYWDGALSGSEHFRICIGDTISETDSVTAFTNSNYSEYWPCCDSSGSTIVGINNNLTITGAVTLLNNDAIYKAVGFNGSSGYLISNQSIINDDNYTIEITAYLNSYGEGSYGALIMCYDASNVKTFLSRVQQGASVNRIVMQNDDGNYLLTNNNSILTGTYYHIAILKKNNSTLTCYINGVLKSTENVLSSGSSDSAKMLVGNMIDESSTFDGTMSNIGITSDIKSANNILTRYNMLMDASNFYGGDYGFYYADAYRPPAEAYGSNVQIGIISRGDSVSEPINVLGFDKFAIESQTFSDYLNASSSTIGVHGCNTIDGTYRPIYVQGVFSGSKGIGKFLRSSFTGNEYTLVNNINGYKYIKVEYSTVCSSTFYIRIHKL